MLHHQHEQIYNRFYPITFELTIQETLTTISVPDIKIPHVNQVSKSLREWMFTTKKIG